VRRLVIRMMVVVCLTAPLFGVTATPSSAAGFPISNCRQHVTIRSVANGRYVTAEVDDGGGYNGMLRARATVVSTWEKFTVCLVGGNQRCCIAIKSEANGKWVSAEFGYSGSNFGMLRARASTIESWEVFVCGMTGPTAKSVMFLNGPKPITSYWVAAELHYTGARYGELRDRTPLFNNGAWENFSSSISSPFNVYCGS